MGLCRFYFLHSWIAGTKVFQIDLTGRTFSMARVWSQAHYILKDETSTLCYHYICRMHNDDLVGVCSEKRLKTCNYGTNAIAAINR